MEYFQITNCDIERRTNYSLAPNSHIAEIVSTGNDDVTRETFIEISEDISGWRKCLDGGPPLSPKEFQVVTVPEIHARIFAGAAEGWVLFLPTNIDDEGSDFVVHKYILR